MVLDADDIGDERMQAIARHFNLSETVFLCRPRAEGADYLARIFTPRREIPFAGHPTIASAFVHATTRRKDKEGGPHRLAQECGVGTVAIEVSRRAGAPFFTLAAGTATAAPVDVSAQAAARLLGCNPAEITDAPIEVCSGGLPWMIVGLRSLAASRGMRSDPAGIEALCRAFGATGVTTYCEGAELPGATHHLRTFAPGVGIAEDPACGSGIIAVAIHMARHVPGTRQHFEFIGEQGLEVGRHSMLHAQVSRDAAGALEIHLGGHAVRSMEGRLLA